MADKNDLTKATFDVAVDVGPSSSSQRESTVQTLTGMLAITQDPETAQVLQSMIMMNMEGDGISQTRDFFRKKLVNMGVIKPTPQEQEQMAKAAENKQPTPNDQAMLAMAAEANAKAKKAQAEAVETGADIEKKKAETAKIYSDINVNKAKAVQELMTRQQQPAGPNLGPNNVPNA